MFTRYGATVFGSEGVRLETTFGRLVLAIAIVGVAGLARAGTMYSGEITFDSGHLVAPTVDSVTNQWGSSGVKLSWEVSDNMDGTWHYKYVFDHSDISPNTSHMLFDISANVDDIDLILNASGGTPKLEQGGDSSNPGLPGNFENAFKMDGTTGTTTTVEWDIARLPTWGDFYAKGGSAQGSGNNFGAAWNSGFLAPDPIVDNGANQLKNGPLLTTFEQMTVAHILVPDSDVPPGEDPDPNTNPVPEPGTALLALFAVLGLITSRRPQRFRS